MGNTLIVVRSFGSYKVGALIENPTQIKEVLEGEHAHSVVRIAQPGYVKPQRLEA